MTHEPEARTDCPDSSDGGRDRESEPLAAPRIFGPRLPAARRYVELLRSTGIAHGHLGPREAARIWSRHVLNCAVVTEAIPRAAQSVVDLGSGAGLPGIPLALARPDLRVVLVEPMLRRIRFLQRVLEEIELPGVELRHARAEDLRGVVVADCVVARAVSSLDQLGAWGLPLLPVGGRLAAIRGENAGAESAAAAPALRHWGGGAPQVVLCGAGLLETPTRVVCVDKARDVRDVGGKGRRGSESKNRRGRGARRGDRDPGRE